jgi:ribosome-binding factor A
MAKPGQRGPVQRGPDHRGTSAKGGTGKAPAGKVSAGKAASRPPMPSKAPTQRMLRVAELIRHKLAEMLARGDVHDDVLSVSVVTVPEVRLSPDLKIATVYVMPLGGKDVKGVLAALERNKKHLRSAVANSVNLKYAPDLRFRTDETFDEAERISRIMNSPKVRQDIAGE